MHSEEAILTGVYQTVGALKRYSLCSMSSVTQGSEVYDEMRSWFCFLCFLALRKEPIFFFHWLCVFSTFLETVNLSNELPTLPNYEQNSKANLSVLRSVLWFCKIVVKMTWVGGR